MKKLKAVKKNSSPEDNTCFVDKVTRTVYVVGEITQKLSSKFRRYIALLDQPEPDGTRADIIVEINSPGGEIEAGLMMIDTMDLAKARIVTRATGGAQSMGSMLLACGSYREALPNSCIMVHQGSFVFRVRAEEIENETSEAKRLEDLCWALLDSRSKQPAGFWKAKCAGKNLYLSSEAALDAGLIDAICRKEQ